MRQRRQPKQRAQRRRRQAQQRMWDSHRRLQERDIMPSHACERPSEDCRGFTSQAQRRMWKVRRRLQGHDIPMLMVMSCSRCDLSFCPMDTSGAVNFFEPSSVSRHHRVSVYFWTGISRGVAVALKYPERTAHSLIPSDCF